MRARLNIGARLIHNVKGTRGESRQPRTGGRWLHLSSPVSLLTTVHDWNMRNDHVKSCFATAISHQLSADAYNKAAEPDCKFFHHVCTVRFRAFPISNENAGNPGFRWTLGTVSRNNMDFATENDGNFTHIYIVKSTLNFDAWSFTETLYMVS